MKQVITLTLAVLALLARIPEGHAATELVWRTPQGGVAVGRTERRTLATLDLSPYDRVRVVVTSRGSVGSVGPRLPATIRLYIGEGEALTLFDTLALTPDPTPVTGTGGAVLGRLDTTVISWGATRLYNHPVIRTLAVVAVGEENLSSSILQRVTFDLFIYGEIEPR